MYSNQNYRTEIFEYAFIEKFIRKNNQDQVESAKVQITGMREIYDSSREVEKFIPYYLHLIPLYGKGGSELQGV